MDFEPGQFLHCNEMHYNQHGMLMLEGQGIYRLGDKSWQGSLLINCPATFPQLSALGAQLMPLACVPAITTTTTTQGIPFPGAHNFAA